MLLRSESAELRGPLPIPPLLNSGPVSPGSSRGAGRVWSPLTSQTLCFCIFKIGHGSDLAPRCLAHRAASSTGHGLSLPFYFPFSVSSPHLPSCLITPRISHPSLLRGSHAGLSLWGASGTPLPGAPSLPHHLSRAGLNSTSGPPALPLWHAEVSSR